MLCDGGLFHGPIEAVGVIIDSHTPVACIHYEDECTHVLLLRLVQDAETVNRQVCGTGDRIRARMDRLHVLRRHDALDTTC